MLGLAVILAACSGSRSRYDDDDDGSAASSPASPARSFSGNCSGYYGCTVHEDGHDVGALTGRLAHTGATCTWQALDDPTVTLDWPSGTTPGELVDFAGTSGGSDIEVNCYPADAGVCRGTPDDCGSIPISACEDQFGCSLDTDSYGDFCAGTPLEDCSEQFRRSLCANERGCTWNPA